MNTGAIDAYISKEVVVSTGDDRFEISVEDAKKIKKDATVGDMVELYQSVDSFGRVAAQTAKQVVLQRLREAEREIILVGALGVGMADNPDAHVGVSQEHRRLGLDS